MSGKRFRGGDVSARLLPEQVKNGALPVIEMLVDEEKCIELVGSGMLSKTSLYARR